MFQGFSDQTSDFLWGIRLNNERGWFLQHRSEYEQYVLTPLRELGKEVYDLFSRGHENRNLRLHTTRIYRDARRLYGRGPYKDCLWFSVQDAAEDWHDYPALWFEIAPEGYRYGMGLYGPSPEMMAAFRRRIDANPAQMRALAERFEAQSEFLLDGETYKRPKGHPGGLLERWYNLKYIDLFHTGGDCAHFRPEFARELAESFRRLNPWYDMLYSVSDTVVKDR